MAKSNLTAESVTLEFVQVRMQLHGAILAVANCTPSDHTPDEMSRLARVKICLDAAVKEIGHFDPALLNIREKNAPESLAANVLPLRNSKIRRLGEHGAPRADLRANDTAFDDGSTDAIVSATGGTRRAVRSACSASEVNHG